MKLRRVAILVTGSREWADRKAIGERLATYVRRRPSDLERIPDRFLVIHGDARGADKIADSVARSLGMETLPMPAQWTKYDRRAGPKRNRRMAEVLDALRDTAWETYVEAFLTPEAKGTRDMLSVVEPMGFTIKRTEGRGA